MLIVTFEDEKWALISEEPVIYLQMCMDVEKSTIYVFGGRVLTR